MYYAIHVHYSFICDWFAYAAPDDQHIEEQCASYHKLRAEAAVQAKLRTEAFQKAAHAKSRREDALAGYYAQEVWRISYNVTI